MIYRKIKINLKLTLDSKQNQILIEPGFEFHFFYAVSVQKWNSNLGLFPNNTLI